MNAIELHKPDGTPTGWTMCGVCGEVARPENRDLTEKCCACYRCGLPLTQIEKRCHSIYHVSCERMGCAEAEEVRLEGAVEVTDYEGPVYLEGIGRGTFGEGCFSDIHELVESLDPERKRPEFAYCCQTASFLGIDARGIYEDAATDMFEDAVEHFNGTDQFEMAVDAFNEANEGLVSWHADFSRKVRIPAAEALEALRK